MLQLCWAASCISLGHVLPRTLDLGKAVRNLDRDLMLVTHRMATTVMKRDRY